MSNATTEQIIEAVGGKLSKDEQSVVVSCGAAGYVRLTPDYVIMSGQELPAASIEPVLRGGKGAITRRLRGQLRAAGIEVS